MLFEIKLDCSGKSQSRWWDLARGDDPGSLQWGADQPAWGCPAEPICQHREVGAGPPSHTAMAPGAGKSPQSRIRTGTVGFGMVRTYGSGGQCRVGSSSVDAEAPHAPLLPEPGNAADGSSIATGRETHTHAALSLHALGRICMMRKESDTPVQRGGFLQDQCVGKERKSGHPQKLSLFSGDRISCNASVSLILSQLYPSSSPARDRLLAWSLCPWALGAGVSRDAGVDGDAGVSRAAGVSGDAGVRGDAGRFAACLLLPQLQCPAWCRVAVVAAPGSCASPCPVLPKGSHPKHAARDVLSL